MNEDIHQDFLSFCEYHCLSPHSKTYSMFVDSSFVPHISEFASCGLIEIRDSIVRMKGVSYDFVLTELGKNVLDFDQL